MILGLQNIISVHRRKIVTNQKRNWERILQKGGFGHLLGVTEKRAGSASAEGTKQGVNLTLRREMKEKNSKNEAQENVASFAQLRKETHFT